MRGIECRRRGGRVLLIGSVVAAVAVGTAFAASGALADEQTLYACAQKPSGILRLVDDAAECRETEKAVQWNVQGPPGPQGEPGAGFSGVTQLEGKSCDVSDLGGVTSLAASEPVAGSGYTTLTLYCLRADSYEPNDTRDSATDLSPTANPFGGFGLTGASIFPAGDEDWYVLRDRTVYRIYVGAGGISVDIYRDGTLVADDVVAGSPYTNESMGESFDWEFHIVAETPGGIAPVYFSGG